MQIGKGRNSNKYRDSWVEINLSNLEYNILSIKKEVSPDVKLLAVVKADAYGHGAAMCAATLLACGVSEFGVASLDEGLDLRQNKISAPILVLGAVPIWSFESAIKNDISVSIYNDEHLEVAKKIYERNGKKLKAHIKIDTGMNRIGIQAENAIDFIKKVQNLPYIDLKGIFTHFADVENEEIFNSQKEKFKNVIKNIDRKNLTIHCSNSPATFRDKTLAYDMLRLGIVLYGLTPLSYDNPAHIKLPSLKEVMGLKGRITNIHKIKKGEGVSYGHTFIAKRDTIVGTIPIGYADGVSRSLSNKIKASLNGSEIKQIGNITMDQMMFDITDAGDVKIGDIVTLLGKDGDNFYSVNDWAKILNTINYELTCRLKVRLPRIYVRND